MFPEIVLSIGTNVLSIETKQTQSWVSVHPSVNPLSAMVAIWHHIIVSDEVFGTERVH